MEICFHCGEEVPSNSRVQTLVKEKEKIYCCSGCEQASKLIYELNGDYFYKLKGNEKITQVKKIEIIEKESLDNDYVYKTYVKNIGEESEIIISLNNLHCAACVWLNEKVVNDIDGVKSSKVNFASGKMKIIWDDKKIKLSDIFSRIKSIGYDPKLNLETQNDSIIKNLFLKMTIAGFGFGSLMAIMTSLYAGFFYGIEIETKKIFHYLSWIITTPVYFYSGSIFFKSAFYSLKNRILNMDFLLVLGISTAYFYSIYVTITNNGEVYFDSVCLIYFLILTGKLIEAIARKKANEKIDSLLAKLPETVLAKRGIDEKIIPISEIEINEIIIIKSGERIPIDGILISSLAEIDESILTGESDLIYKKKGDEIYSGSFNYSNLILIQTSKKASESRLSSLKNLIESSLLEKPNIQRKTEKIAFHFISLILSLAVLSFIYSYFTNGQISESLIRFISVLIVACPCALGLAIPSTLVINNYINAKKGIVIKNLDIIEPLSKTNLILLDKTGTITDGNLKIKANLINPDFAIPIVHSIEKYSNHPIAKSLTEFTKSNLNDNSEILELKEIFGEGIFAKLKKENSIYEVYIGNSKLIKKNLDKKFATKLLNTEENVIHVLINKIYYGNFEIIDSIREGFEEEVLKLKKLVPEIKIISGDKKESVEKISSILGIKNFQAEMSPIDKLKILSEEQKNGKIVLMVGDGMNDSATLAKSNISISHSKGMDYSIDKSDIILIQDDLKGIRYSIEFAKLAVRKMNENILISFLYNSIMIPLAFFGLMQPIYCAVFMSLSSITVILNSLRLYFTSEKIK